ncbi:hypothetical protein [Ileibacterium valens]|uniref:hypothetical protein n=1 Tax=Ileibacterium valens TaxID=1862668 RepID=UPI0025706B34|nr:hypothetical protein [Ileibacterium valens]
MEIKRYVDVLVLIKKDRTQIPGYIVWDERYYKISSINRTRKVMRDSRWCDEYTCLVNQRIKLLYRDIEENRWFIYTDQIPSSDFEYETI